MGVGKTLTAIATIWAFVRGRGANRKALVICPSSLVDNWVKEIKHWLGTKVKPLVIRSGGDASSIINTFAISLSSLYPLMVLSYEVLNIMIILVNVCGLLYLIKYYVIVYYYRIYVIYNLYLADVPKTRCFA